MKKLVALLLCLPLLSGCATQAQNVDVTQSKESASPGNEAPQTVAVATPQPTPAPYVTDDVFVVNCEDNINLREKSSSKSEQIGTLLAGDKVKILGYQSQRFARVQLESNDQVGYAIAGYFKVEDYASFGLETVKPVEKYSYEQMMADLETLASKYPDLCFLESAGQSVQGRELQAIVIGDANASHHVLVQGSMHARENMCSLLCTALAERLLQKGGEADVCFHILPMVNPDGVTIQQSAEMPENILEIYKSDGAKGLSVDTGLVYLAQWQANANGVDLNRNFDALWDKIDTTEGPSFTNYRGTAVESEPETKALVTYTDQYKFDATLSYHATGSALYWEFGEDAAINAASLHLAEAIKAVSAYEPIGDSGGSYGGYKDWAMLQKKIPSVTIEIGTRTAPLLEAEFSNVWFRNRDVLPAVAQWIRAQ
ncbi:MAG: M14 family zinc carboxypeptidase [Candidatus Pelethousia sp.]|nr:M14 family zinc carboxypeptidase [Candidatus Pelethousia sp.]